MERRIPASEMIGLVALVRNYVSEERIASIIRVMQVIRSSETSVLIRATRCNILECDIIRGQRSENLKPYIALTGWPL
jgi:hypothetical protein